jgi:hypothetical protein
MKQKVIKFSPEHERRLRRLCIKTQFLKNIAAHGHDVENYALWSIENKIGWGGLINSAFIWSESPEGDAYWENIANIKTRKKKS